MFSISRIPRCLAGLAVLRLSGSLVTATALTTPPARAAPQPQIDQTPRKTQTPPARSPKPAASQPKGEGDAAADVHAAAAASDDPGRRNHHRADPKGASFRRPFPPKYPFLGVEVRSRALFVSGFPEEHLPVKDWMLLGALIGWVSFRMRSDRLMVIWIGGLGKTLFFFKKTFIVGFDRRV